MTEQIESAEVIETLGTEAVVTSEQLLNGKYRVGLRTIANRKKFRSIQVASKGEFYKHRYLSWAYHFKCYNKATLFEMVKNGRLLAAKCEGQIMMCRDDVEREAEQLKEQYSGDGAIFDYRIKKAKAVPSDEFTESEAFGIYAVYREGCISDYFRFDEVLSVLEKNGVSAEMFEEPLKELFSRPISELIAEDLNGYELIPSPVGLGFIKSGSSFTFQEFFETDIQFIAAKLLQGDPIEGIAAELAARERQRT